MSVPGSNEQFKKSALIFTIVGFLCGGVIAGVLGLLAYLKADDDPVAAAKFLKWSKIVLIVSVALWVLIIVLNILLTIAAGSAANAAALALI